jgi:transcriptional regulator with XRE-family HTH domain
MNSTQCKMARVALGWGIRDLARRAKVAPGTVSRFEAGEELKERTIDALQAALEAAGVVFFDGVYSGDGGPGVRLARSSGRTIEMDESERTGERGLNMAKKPKVEHSELSGEFTEDGVTVLVDIFRPAGTNSDWRMEVVTPEEDLVEWEEPFATDREAFDEFLATIARDGIRSFFEETDPSVH